MSQIFEGTRGEFQLRLKSEQVITKRVAEEITDKNKASKQKTNRMSYNPSPRPGKHSVFHELTLEIFFLFTLKFRGNLQNLI